MIAALLAATALAGPDRLVFDRVDLLSEAAPAWQRYEASRLGTAPGVATVRWLAQITPVAAFGPASFGLSLDSQWVALGTKLSRDDSARIEAAAIASGLLPVGGRVGVSWRPGSLRLGLSAVALSGATWVRPSYRSWTVLPSVGVGVGRNPHRAPWM